MKHVTTLLLSLFVCGAMAFILTYFLKRLKKIESDFWGTTSIEAEQQLAEARERLFKTAETKTKPS